MGPEQYSAMKTLIKAGLAFLGTMLGGSVAVVANVGMPETWDEFKSQWPVIVVSLGIGVWRAVDNWRKQRAKALA